MEQPLMKAVLADLALESEAATALALRLAHAIDRSEAGSAQAVMRRLVIPRPRGQVLDLQARQPLRPGSDGMPERQRLCRGRR
ncbi:MAG: hypothetical protein U1F50_11935 [Rubrivivax sp.]